MLNPRDLSEIKALEARKPDREQAPDQFRIANEEITKKIDTARLWASASGRKNIV